MKTRQKSGNRYFLSICCRQFNNNQPFLRNYIITRCRMRATKGQISSILKLQGITNSNESYLFIIHRHDLCENAWKGYTGVVRSANINDINYTITVHDDNLSSVMNNLVRAILYHSYPFIVVPTFYLRRRIYI